MTGHSFAAHQPGCALCVCGEWDHHPVHGPNFDRSEITADERASFDRRRPLVEAQLTRRGEKASPALIDAVTTAVERGWFIFDGSTSHIELRRPNAQNTGGAELTIWRQAGNGQFVGSLLRRYVDVSRPRTYVELAQVIEVDDAF